MRIERERFVILKKSRHGLMILCTLANQPKFRYVLRLQGEQIRSYMSEAKAKQAFKRHFGAWNPKRYRIARVIETFQSVTQRSRMLKELRERVDDETNISESLPRFVEGDVTIDELAPVTLREGVNDTDPPATAPFDLDTDLIRPEDDADWELDPNQFDEDYLTFDDDSEQNDESLEDIEDEEEIEE